MPFCGYLHDFTLHHKVLRMNSLDLHSVSLPSDSESSLRTLLFRDSYRVESPAEIVAWWEKRRLAYNVAVGATGLVGLASIFGLGSLGPFQHPMGPPLIGVVIYAVLANIAYTSGWVAELCLRPFFGARTGTVGATLFRYGLAFSVGITAIPTAIGFMDFGIRMIRWVVGG